MKMDGEDGHLAQEDAVFISTHKFIGGPEHPEYWWQNGTSFRTQSPRARRGNSVYVNSHEHRYHSDPVHCEEGVPDIIGAICGLVYQLKEARIEWIAVESTNLFAVRLSVGPPIPTFGFGKSRSVAFEHCVLYDPLRKQTMHPFCGGAVE